MAEKNDAKSDRDAANRRTSFIAIVVVVVLFVVGWFLTQEIYSNTKTEDCVMSGRTNCIPIDTRSSTY